MLSKALALLVGIIGDSLFRLLLFLVISRPTPDSGGMVLVFLAAGSNIAG